MDRHEKRRKRRGIKYDRHVRLHYWVMDTKAYRALSPEARVVLLELMRLYNGENNGRIALSVRDAGDLCLISKSTAARSFIELSQKGFIEQCKPSAFTVKNRIATEWTLTEFLNDATSEIASKTFMRWQPPTVPGEGHQIQNTVPRNGLTVPREGQ